jgi:hypothetical protein
VLDKPSISLKFLTVVEDTSLRDKINQVMDKLQGDLVFPVDKYLRKLETVQLNMNMSKNLRADSVYDPNRYISFTFRVNRF